MAFHKNKGFICSNKSIATRDIGAYTVEIKLVAFSYNDYTRQELNANRRA
jgi:hypothetical protein